MAEASSPSLTTITAGALGVGVRATVFPGDGNGSPSASAGEVAVPIPIVGFEATTVLATTTVGGGLFDFVAGFGAGTTAGAATAVYTGAERDVFPCTSMIKREGLGK